MPSRRVSSCNCFCFRLVSYTLLSILFLSSLLTFAFHMIFITLLDISNAERLGDRKDSKTIEEKEWVASDADPINNPTNSLTSS